MNNKPFKITIISNESRKFATVRQWWRGRERGVERLKWSVGTQIFIYAFGIQHQRSEVKCVYAYTLSLNTKKKKEKKQRIYYLPEWNEKWEERIMFCEIGCEATFFIVFTVSAKYMMKRWKRPFFSFIEKRLWFLFLFICLSLTRFFLFFFSEMLERYQAWTGKMTLFHW